MEEELLLLYLLMRRVVCQSNFPCSEDILDRYSIRTGKSAKGRCGKLYAETLIGTRSTTESLLLDRMTEKSLYGRYPKVSLCTATQTNLQT